MDHHEKTLEKLIVEHKSYSVFSRDDIQKQLVACKVVVSSPAFGDERLVLRIEGIHAFQRL